MTSAEQEQRDRSLPYTENSAFPSSVPWLRRPSKGVEEPERKKGGEADGHGVGVRVRADVREEVLELLHLHLVAG